MNHEFVTGAGEGFGVIGVQGALEEKEFFVEVSDGVLKAPSFTIFRKVLFFQREWSRSCPSELPSKSAFRKETRYRIRCRTVINGLLPYKEFVWRRWFNIINGISPSNNTRRIELTGTPEENLNVILSVN